MNLNKIQFDILSILAENNDYLNEKILIDKTKYSIEIINKCLKELEEKDFISKFEITSKGLKILEPYKVKRAIFLAAGVGKRLNPITLNTPKPLVKVLGMRIIDRLIDSVIKAGINEIIIVIGYLSNQFEQLKVKYPNIQFVYNPLFEESNNIGSILQVNTLLENAYIFESDLLIYNPSIIKKYQYYSNFLAIKKDTTNDWCFTLRNGFINEEKIGGIDCYQMVGISYWNKEDGKKLSCHIKEAYNLPDGKELFWEQVPLVKFKDNYKVYVRECSDNDITEIDTFEELSQIDSNYI